MDQEGERESRLTSWVIAAFVITILTSVTRLFARLLVGFLLATAKAPPWVISAADWIVYGAVLITVILGWRSMQKAVREEEQRGR